MATDKIAEAITEDDIPVGFSDFNFYRRMDDGRDIYFRYGRSVLDDYNALVRDYNRGVRKAVDIMNVYFLQRLTK